MLNKYISDKTDVAMNMYLSFMQRMLLMVVGLVCASYVSAYDFKAENEDGVTIYYEINGNNVTVTSGDQRYEGDVRIPATVMNEDVSYNVTAIGAKAFYFCDKLTAIEIPSTVTSIELQQTCSLVNPRQREVCRTKCFPQLWHC